MRMRKRRSLPRWVICGSADGAEAMRKGIDELRALRWVEPGECEVVAAARAATASEACFVIARMEGIFPAPEAGACLLELSSQLARGAVQQGHRAVIVNSGSGFGYTSSFAKLMPARPPEEADKLGGLITPR